MEENKKSSNWIVFAIFAAVIILMILIKVLFL
jgi:hypothetical protein